MPNPIRHYNATLPDVHPEQFGDLRMIIPGLLRGEPVRYEGDWAELLELAEQNGILPWLAWQARAGHVGKIADEQARARLRHALRKASVAKMLGDAELARLFHAARERGIELLVLKGEALARSLYPDPACRPAADLDLLVAPGQLSGMQALLEDLGYAAPIGFHGTHIFGEQCYRHVDRGSGFKSLVDLHWDISNRRFFRNRLAPAALFECSMEVPLADGSIRTPGLAQALLIACVHLAGTFPEDTLQLKWLLDICLLLEALGDRDLEALLESARAMKLDDVVYWYCAMTGEVLGPGQHAERFAGPASGTRSRRRMLRWSHAHRWFDLLEYGARLKGWPEKREFLRQAGAYRAIRKQR